MIALAQMGPMKQIQLSGIRPLNWACLQNQDSALKENWHELCLRIRGASCLFQCLGEIIEISMVISTDMIPSSANIKDLGTEL